MTILAKRVRVAITRQDLHTITSEVFEHEIPVLLTVFGQGNVQVIEDKELPAQELEDGIDGEHARLQRKYRRPDADSSPAVRVFPSASDLARALGVNYQPHTGLTPAMPESVQYDGAAEADAPKVTRGKKKAVEADE